MVSTFYDLYLKMSANSRKEVTINGQKLLKPFMRGKRGYSVQVDLGLLKSDS